MVDACEKRATNLQLPVDGPRRFAACGDLEQPSLAWSKGGTRSIAGAQHEFLQREYAAIRVVEVAKPGGTNLAVELAQRGVT